MHDIHQRKGFVKIATELFESLSADEIKEIYSNVFPIDFVWGYEKSEFLCLSPHFDIVQEGELTPYYEIVLKDNEGQLKFIKAKKL
jgi:hypothetical protein